MCFMLAVARGRPPYASQGRPERLPARGGHPSILYYLMAYVNLSRFIGNFHDLPQSSQSGPDHCGGRGSPLLPIVSYVFLSVISISSCILSKVCPSGQSGGPPVTPGSPLPSHYVLCILVFLW